MQPTLYLMLGYPGAGKTTTAKVVSELTGAVHLSSDQMRLELFPQPTFSEAEHQQLYTALNDKTEQLLKEGKSVVYDANLNRYQHRKEKYDICQQTGAMPLVLWVMTPRDLARERAVHESRMPLTTPHESLAAMFDRIASVIEEPRENEKVISVDGTKVSRSYLAELLGSR